jgi:hypothetical protein
MRTRAGSALMRLEGPAAAAAPRLMGPPAAAPAADEVYFEQDADAPPQQALRLTGPADAPRLTGPAPAAPSAADAVADVAGTSQPADAIFVPSYQWQILPPGAVVPAGLAVEMPLDGRPSRARIPPRWQLKVYIDANDHGYFRHDCTAKTTVGALRAAAAAALAVARDAVTLTIDGAAVDDSQSAEEARLFERMSRLKVLVREM